MNSLAIEEITPAQTGLCALVSRHDSVEAANAQLRELTGIRAFLRESEWERVREGRALFQDSAAPRTIREWGDFQTPPTLARTVCQFLQSQGIAPHVVLEPTYGLGHFLTAALEFFPDAALFYGVEIQVRYEWHFKMTLLQKALRGEVAAKPIHLFHDSIFTHRFEREISESDDLLIVGNPPWVTSAELGALDSANLPVKFNRDNLTGLSALTGKSNFDLNEAILLRLLETFGARRGTLALLCKNSVIKNWVERLPRLSTKVNEVRALEIDAAKEFGAAVSASLLFARFGQDKRVFSCAVATLAAPEKALKRFGWCGSQFVSNLDSYGQSAALDGVCPVVWRQGIKHDCSAVMELSRVENGWVNGLGEAVNIESEFVFPLFKSSDLRGVPAVASRKWVIVPQRTLGEDTNGLQKSAPKLWEYLSRNRSALGARKSSIYRGKPAFSIFGIGDYSFAPFKVAVSGLYKIPRFTLLEPIGGQSAMLDDTCYFLGFEGLETARLVTFLLESAPAKSLLESLVFSDAKRPYTKELLMRLDLTTIRARIQAQDFVEFWARHGVDVEEAEFECELSPQQTGGQLLLL